MGKEIRIDYSDIKNKASRIKGHSFELKYQIYKLQMEKNSLNRAWDGPASRVYLQKLDELITRMNATQRKMSEAADLIRLTADRIKRADLEAEERARQL